MIAPQNNQENKVAEEHVPWDEGQYQTPRSVHRFAWGFGVFMVLTAGVGFFFKLFEFLNGFTADGELHFAVIPVMTYLVVAAGYLCLFMWAYLGGQFKNVEAAKYRMLQMQQEIDAQASLDAQTATELESE